MDFACDCICVLTVIFLTRYEKYRSVILFLYHIVLIRMVTPNKYVCYFVDRKYEMAFN